MLLLTVIFLLTSTRNTADALNCPYSSLASGYWRSYMLVTHNAERRVVAQLGAPGFYPPAKQMNAMAWNCETEYNLNKIQLELNNNDSVVYRNFGVNTGWGDACDSDGMEWIMFHWTEGELVIPSNLEYNGDPTLRTTANVLKWNSTEMACAYRSFDSGNSVRLICAYNARGDVVGQQIYEEGNGTCEEGTQCGDNGTCVYDLCRVPTTNPGIMLNAARVFILVAVLSSGYLSIRGDVGKSGDCKCPNRNVTPTCYKTKEAFLARYVKNGEVAVGNCDKQCFNKRIFESLEIEKNQYGPMLRNHCYVTRCPCICEYICESHPDKFEKVDCPQKDDAYFAPCSAATTQVEQHSSSSSETSTGTSQPQTTMEDHLTSEDGVNDFGSTSSRGATILTSPVPSAMPSISASTLFETSLRDEVSDKTTSMTMQTSQETGATATTAPTTTVYGTTEDPFQAPLTTSTVGIDEPSTNEARSTSETDLPSISESTTGSTLESTTDTIRASECLDTKPPHHPPYMRSPQKLPQLSEIGERRRRQRPSQLLKLQLS
ncbi:hypothetical protein Q1695_004170 [Nippostrongylus brasiliensis]|nr:hypothetical protein Q1695_004170 [Nippostrongylus brasiliensis]